MTSSRSINIRERGKSRIKIAYVTATDACDKKSWSGTHYFIARALEKHCGDVSYIGPLYAKSRLPLLLLSRSIQFLSAGRKRYDHRHSIILSKEYGRAVSSAISSENFDLVFAPAASTEIAHLQTDIPIVYLSDTTFSLIVNYYEIFSNLLSLSKKEGESIERSAIGKASLILLSSRWAAVSAIEDYNADKGKVRVVPFGANLDDVPPACTVIDDRFSIKSHGDKCKLLFLAAEWQRKGGEIAFDTLLELEKAGIPAELVVCGCSPPKKIAHDNLRVIPFLDKNKSDEYELFKRLLLDTDFLLLPTRQDCTPIAFCDANAFGLPIITTNTGGIPSVVTNGINGFMLPLSARGGDFANLIQRIFLDKPLYKRLVRTSRTEFESRLNWDAWGRKVKGAVQKLLSRELPYR